MMSLSKRETILLFVLFFIIVSAVYYSYYLVPINKEIQTISQQNSDLKTKAAAMNQKVTALALLNKTLAEKQDEASKKYLSVMHSTDDALALHYINTVLAGKADAISVSFDGKSQDYNNAKVFSAKVDFGTNYSNLVAILNEFEETQIDNRVFSMSFETPTSGGVQISSYPLLVTLNIDFFTSDIANTKETIYPFLSGQYGKNLNG